MIRVGFVFDDDAWLGGINYFRNLLSAISDLPQPRIVPVVIVRSDLPLERLEGFPSTEIIRTRLVEPGGVLWKARRGLQVFAERDFLFEIFLRRHQIDFLSHSGHLGKYCSIKTLAWIPDFQELHLPDFFSQSEIARRQRTAREACSSASALLLSSDAARGDLPSVCQPCAASVELLPFVATVPQSGTPIEELQARYAFQAPYFHLPNQFWAHKNHGVVLEALACLKAQGRHVQILATGDTHDRRRTDYFSTLMARAADLNVTDTFRVLGRVPYDDLVGLMKASVAVINPSLFEGWSTTVEEAKSMGKAVILSDIPTHREQNPDRGFYFEPHDPVQLADALSAVLSGFDALEDERCKQRALRLLPERRRKFAERFEDIVLRTLAKSSEPSASSAV